MAIFQKRPPTVEARQWSMEAAEEIARWARSVGGMQGAVQLRQVIVHGEPEWRLRVGGAEARPGDWIVLMEDGGLCVCNAVDFEARFEPVQTPEPEPEPPAEQPEQPEGGE